MDVGIHEAKTHLSRLIKRVALGEEINIRNGSRIVARLVPAQDPSKREFGRDRGLFEVPEDFNAQLPEELLRAFEG